jgi:hypothetical protein
MGWGFKVWRALLAAPGMGVVGVIEEYWYCVCGRQVSCLIVVKEHWIHSCTRGTDIVLHMLHSTDNLAIESRE